MSAFRILLVVMFIVVAGYTAIVAANHGLGLFAIFFSDLATLTWPGQFNLDFLFMLTLAALWLAWRHRFSPLGIVIAILGLFGGVFFLSAYLLLASIAAKGDIKTLLLGKIRVASETCHRALRIAT